MRQLGLEDVGALQRGVDGVALLGRLENADAAARLHGRGGDAIDHEVMLDHMRGLGEGGVGRFLVSFDLDEADIVRAIVPDQRHAGLDRVAGRDDGRQRLVIDLDQLGGIDRLVIGLGHDEGDIVADHAHPVLDQGRIARPIAGRVAAALEPARHRQVAEARGLVVGAGDHREHAGRGFGLGGVDLADAGMGVRRAQHIAMRRAGKHHVGDIAAAALDQSRIFEARDRLADGEFTHCILIHRHARLTAGHGHKGLHRLGMPFNRARFGATLPFMTEQPQTGTFEAALKARADAMADACTRCGKCVEVCPATEAAGLTVEQRQNPVHVIDGIIDIVRHGQGNEAARKWASGCLFSGECIKACDYGVNPRFLLYMARIEMAHAKETVAQRRDGVEAFRKVAVEVKHLSQMQLDDALLARLGQGANKPATGEKPGFRVLHRLQRAQDAAHRAAGARHHGFDRRHL